MLRDTFLDTADVTAGLLRDPALAAKWREPSALADFSVTGLARHLANQVTALPGFLARPSGTGAIPVLEHYTRNSWVTSGVDSDDNRDIRGWSEQRAAGTTPEALAGEVDGALAVVRALSRRGARPGDDRGLLSGRLRAGRAARPAAPGPLPPGPPGPGRRSPGTAPRRS